MILNQTPKGFTLLELLLVIAIIGILSTVAVVNLRQAKEKAAERAIWATLNSIRNAATLCVYEDSPLKCGADGNKPCEGPAAQDPVPGNPLCQGGDTVWTDLQNDCYSWSMPNSNLDETTFCIEIERAGGACGWLFGVPTYYTCTDKGCQTDVNFSPTCSDSCSPEGYPCINNNDCCGHHLYCKIGLCERKPGVGNL